MFKKNILFKALPLAIALCTVLSACSVEVDTPEEQTVPGTTAQNTTDVADTTLQASEANGSKLDVVDYSTEPVIWGPGNIKDHARPADPEKLQNKYSEMSGQWLLPEQKTICLTFDEGYENGFTAQILDTLAEKNVKAIFFCTYDYVRDNPDLVHRMINEGHILANHSYSHYNMTEVDLETAEEEITLMHDYVEENFNYSMGYFRFPEGVFSEQTLALAAQLGYRSVFWSFAYEDWDADNPPDETEAFEKITSSTHDGEIMLLHAVSETNANFLGNVIDNIREQGYEFTVEL